MDQLKPLLAKLKKNQFWILLGIIIVVSLAVWYTAVGELEQQYAADVQRNETAFRSLQMFNVVKTNEPPNPEYKKAVDDLREDLEVQVEAAWRELFERQRSVLKVNPRVPDLAPYLTEESHAGRDIPPAIRDIYHNNQIIEDDFRELFSMLNLRRIAGTNPVDEQPANDGRAAIEGTLVWAAVPAPRSLMLRYKTVLTPNAARIRMTQEDLWIFRSMFGVIRSINSRPIDVWLEVLDGKEPVDAPVDQANVPIKQIDFCDLAQYAMSAALGRPGQVEMNLSGGSKMGAGRMGGKGQSAFSVTTTGSAAEDEKLAKGRYIDGRNNPVDDPSSPPFSEFKQIFVQMEVVMDQRLIPVLIAECANAEIPIETRQLLVDLNDVDLRRAANAGEAARSINKIEQSPHDVRVTLRGVMYGYSPPKKENLGKGSDPEPSRRDYGVPGKAKEVTF